MLTVVPGPQVWNILAVSLHLVDDNTCFMPLLTAYMFTEAALIVTFSLLGIVYIFYLLTDSLSYLAVIDCVFSGVSYLSHLTVFFDTYSTLQEWHVIAAQNVSPILFKI